jgi:hypothetical protein
MPDMLNILTFRTWKKKKNQYEGKRGNDSGYESSLFREKSVSAVWMGVRRKHNNITPQRTEGESPWIHTLL